MHGDQLEVMRGVACGRSTMSHQCWTAVAPFRRGLVGDLPRPMLGARGGGSRATGGCRATIKAPQLWEELLCWVEAEEEPPRWDRARGWGLKASDVWA